MVVSTTEEKAERTTKDTNKGKNNNGHQQGKEQKKISFLQAAGSGCQNRYVDSFSAFSSAVFPVISPVWTKVDGRLNNFANAWLSLSDDQWILSTVIHGYGIELIEPPVQHSIPSGCIMSIEMETIYNQ